MANFDKNEDLIIDNPLYVQGVQYDVLTDLPTEPVTVAFFKEHARIDFDTDDTLVTQYLIAARKYLENWSQLSFGVKTMQLTALQLPKNYKLLYGRVDTVTTTGYTLFGDRIKEGGDDIILEYTTTGTIDETIKIAICRYAAGLYINRENVTDTKFSSQQLHDEAKQMLQPYRNYTPW